MALEISLVAWNGRTDGAKTIPSKTKSKKKKEGHH
jgi:hypothetical protein